MCANSPPPISKNSVRVFGGKQTTFADAGVASIDRVLPMIEQVLRGFLPHVCNDNVYRFEHRQIKDQRDPDAIICHCSWTFYNDERITLKIRFLEDMVRITEPTLEKIRNIAKPMVDDPDEWMADAIMRCEAGEDIWERPKLGTSGSTSQGPSLTATEIALRQQQAMQGLAQQQGAITSAMTQRAGSGLVSELAAQMGIRGILKQ